MRQSLQLIVGIWTRAKSHSLRSACLHYQCMCVTLVRSPTNQRRSGLCPERTVERNTCAGVWFSTKGQYSEIIICGPHYSKRNQILLTNCICDMYFVFCLGVRPFRYNANPLPVTLLLHLPSLLCFAIDSSDSYVGHTRTRQCSLA